MRVQSDDVEDVKLTDPSNKRSNYRFVILFWCSMGFGFMIYLRLNLNVAIVAMVNRTAIGEAPAHHLISLNSTLIYDIERDSERESASFLEPQNASVTANGTFSTLKSSKYPEGPFVWSESLQGIILGAFYFGFTPTQVIAARLVEKYDAVKFAGYGMLLSALFTALTPVAADLGVVSLIVARALIGVCQGPFSICIFVLISRWLPKTERSVAIALVTVGVTFGSAIGIPLTALLCEFGPLGGWPSAFVASGVLTALWTFCWFYFVTEFPTGNKNVNGEELEHILSNKEGDNTHNKKASAPWKKMFNSGGVWASIVAKASTIFAIQLIHSKLPVYLETVLGLSLQTNGIVNASVNFSAMFSTLGSGYLADYMHRKKFYSLTNIRKMFQTVTMLGPAICFALIPLCGSDATLVILLLVISFISIGFISGGDIPITTDMAPHFSGTLFGITNTVSSAMGFVAPTVIGVILDADHGSPNQWAIVFYMTSGLLVFGVVFFDIFATAEVQAWGLVPNEDPDEQVELKQDQREEVQGIAHD